MSEKLNKCVSESLAAARGGLICMPSRLAEAVDAEVPRDSRIALHRWFTLPRHRQAPRAPVAMCKLTDDALTVAIVDDRTGKLHSVVEGSRDELPRFAMAVVELLDEPVGEPIKVPSGGPGDTPGVDEPIKVPSGGPGDTPGVTAARLASVQKVVPARVRRRVRRAQRLGDQPVRRRAGGQ